MIEWMTALSTWDSIRAFGVISYVLFSFAVCVGIMCGIPVWNEPAKRSLLCVHRGASAAGAAIGLLYGAAAAAGGSPSSWEEALIPFAAKNEPFVTGLGMLASYGMIVILFSTDIRGKMGKRAWRTAHLLPYPIWVMTLVHGFSAVADSGSHHIRFLYMFSAVSVLSVTMLRLSIHPASHKTVTKQRRSIRRQD
ncbi:hypothetical protein [Paenibacillus sp. MBLB4367]|uniref:hypothetical protein n=1 Tax=Paenibacillus sp. MBLB4367 TaxID=3384767 RepID=UPI0039081EDA